MGTDELFRLSMIIGAVIIGVSGIALIICELIDIWEEKMARKQFEEWVNDENDIEKSGGEN